MQFEQELSERQRAKLFDIERIDRECREFDARAKDEGWE
jgi:hypothetical protein